MPRWENAPLENRHRAQEMRKEPTPAEKILWRSLRGDRLGVGFRRQHLIGPYIVDFYCPAAHLVIELDGDTHATPEAAARDAHRDAYLRRRGLRVRRYTNVNVYENKEGVLKDILRLVQNSEPPLGSPR